MVASTVDTGELYGWGWNKYSQLHPHTHSTTNNNSNNNSSTRCNNDIYHDPIRLTGFDNLLLSASSGADSGGDEQEGEEGCIDEVVCGSRYTAILTHNRQRILVM